MSKSTLDRTHQARILVVDDEADVRLLLAREISDRGHEVVVAADSAQAMEEMGRGDVDVVLTDIRMPGMDGIELTEWIKSTSPQKASVWWSSMRNPLRNQSVCPARGIIGVLGEQMRA